MTPTLNIDIIFSYSPFTIQVVDITKYPQGWNIVNPSLQVTAAGFPTTTIDFTPNSINFLDSSNIGCTAEGEPLVPLQDGIYTFTYSIAATPAIPSITKNVFRVNQLQEKFDNVFMSLDIMECDGPIRKQKQEELNTIYLYIQGAIAAANNCALSLASQLYNKAFKSLNNFNGNMSSMW